MAAVSYTLEPFGGLLHRTFGPVGFALRYCGQSSEAVAQIWKLNGLVATVCTISLFVGFATWMFLALSR